ncbi:hypothetical protein JOB18_035853 [Solea senegalensis]|uniref:Uncharacterized protein n=1 Tax=Solea senegalensis TaxID=28829 RepID=A0AAV6SI69_SOLSE|nr:hypothetical protein JOB18_035853 [Solea senegalensis]
MTSSSTPHSFIHEPKAPPTCVTGLFVHIPPLIKSSTRADTSGNISSANHSNISFTVFSPVSCRYKQQKKSKGPNLMLL